MTPASQLLAATLAPGSVGADANTFGPQGSVQRVCCGGFEETSAAGWGWGRSLLPCGIVLPNLTGLPLAPTRTWEESVVCRGNMPGARETRSKRPNYPNEVQ